MPPLNIPPGGLSTYSLLGRPGRGGERIHPAGPAAGAGPDGGYYYPSALESPLTTPREGSAFSARSSINPHSDSSTSTPRLLH